MSAKATGLGQVLTGQFLCGQILSEQFSVSLTPEIASEQSFEQSAALLRRKSNERQDGTDVTAWIAFCR